MTAIIFILLCKADATLRLRARILGSWEFGRLMTAASCNVPPEDKMDNISPIPCNKMLSH